MNFSKLERGAFRALLVLGVFGAIAGQTSACPWLREPYQQKILPKITAGVPFEMVSIETNGDELLDKQFIRIEYDLWDETVVMSAGKSAGKPLPLKEVEAEICNILGNGLKKDKNTKSAQWIYLNPIFEGRLERIANRMASHDNAKELSLLEINWKRIMRANGKDSLILKRDL